LAVSSPITSPGAGSSWIFFVNGTIGVIGILATLFFLTERVKRKPAQLDISAAVLQAIGMGGLMLGISFGHEWG
jgi:hypothetical protein